MDKWKHNHVFDQNRIREGERKTLLVIGLTITMMLIEVISGMIFGSMALLADGLHMASHSIALGIAAFAYSYARRHADDRQYSFGTGKVNALGGFTGAVLLALFAVLMAWESSVRLFHPVDIVYNQAILVAVTGLIVNGICAWILGAGNHHDHANEHHDHGHDHDLNLESAYLHVLADALTSILAIIALVTAKYQGLVWMDAFMGIVGAILVARWSTGLIRSSSQILLDHQGPSEAVSLIKECIEGDMNSRIVDLHLWKIGPSSYSLALTVVADRIVSADIYKSRIPDDLGIDHMTVEVHTAE